MLPGTLELTFLLYEKWHGRGVLGDRMGSMSDVPHSGTPSLDVLFKSSIEATGLINRCELKGSLQSLS